MTTRCGRRAARWNWTPAHHSCRETCFGSTSRRATTRPRWTFSSGIFPTRREASRTSPSYGSRTRHREPPAIGMPLSTMRSHAASSHRARRYGWRCSTPRSASATARSTTSNGRSPSTRATWCSSTWSHASTRSTAILASRRSSGAWAFLHEGAAQGDLEGPSHHDCAQEQQGHPCNQGPPHHGPCGGRSVAPGRNRPQDPECEQAQAREQNRKQGGNQRVAQLVTLDQSETERGKRRPTHPDERDGAATPRCESRKRDGEPHASEQYANACRNHPHPS